MTLLIILGSRAGAPAAAAAGPEPAGPAPPGVAELAGKLCFPLGMIYVSIPRVKYVPSIYRYLSDTVPEVSRMWYTTICDTCKLYLSVHIVFVSFTVTIFVRVLLYRTETLYLYFLFVQLCFARILYTVIPDPFGAGPTQFPEVVFVKNVLPWGRGCV
jgi:hypothetical protein